MHRVYLFPHLLLFERPGFRRPTATPCRFVPREAGRGFIPFDFLHSSLLEPRGPCVEMRLDCDSVSTCIESKQNTVFIRCLTGLEGVPEPGSFGVFSRGGGSRANDEEVINDRRLMGDRNYGSGSHPGEKESRGEWHLPRYGKSGTGSWRDYPG